MDDRRVLVAIRVRPKLENAINQLQSNERYHLEAAAKTSDTGMRLSDGKTGRDGKTHNFTFDMVFDKDSTQLDVYEETTLDAVDAVLMGCNATIMTYGQTGSGKTYTVLGAVKRNPLTNDIITADTGLFLRALKDILSYAESRAKDLHVVIGLSVLEIYLDEVRDLLSSEATPPVVIVSVIRDTLSIPNITYKPIKDLNDAVTAYKLANARRVSRATSANDTSSRSHAVFSIEIFQQPRTPANPEPLDAMKLCEIREKHQLAMNTGDIRTPLSNAASSPATYASLSAPASPNASGAAGNTTLEFGARASNPLLNIAGTPPVMFSKLVLTDLAGSEKIKNSRVRGDGLEELKKINASLTALGNVVHALYEGAKHIPYRDTKLTILLRESFAAPNSKIVLIANASPTVLTFDETLSTLFFADKVKGMKVENPQSADVARLELEFLETMKSLEEIAADLRIAKELHDAQLVIRKFGPPTMLDSKFSLIKRTPNVPREKELKILHEQALNAARQRQEVKRQEQQDELSNLAKVVRAEAVDGYKTTRDRVNTLLTDLKKSREEDNVEVEEVIKELMENIRLDEKESHALSAEISKLQPLSHQLPKEKAELDSIIVSLSARIEEMERKFFEQNKEVEQDWDAHQKAHAKQQVQWAASSNFAESCLALWKAKGDFASARGEHLQLVSEVSMTKYESETMDVSHWIRSAIVRIARNAVAVSISKTRKAPNTRPASRSSTAGASTSGSMRRDPESSNMSTTTTATDDAADDAAAVRAATRTRKRGTLYDQPTLMGEILSYVQYGCMILKYGRSGAPHYRIFYILTTEDEGSRLCWDEQDDGRRLGKGSYIPLESVSRIILGQYTPVFKRIPGGDGFYNSFSLEYIHKQQPRTLDLVCDTDAELESWVIAVAYATKKNPCFLEPMPNLKLLPGYSNLTSKEDEVCSKWHIQPEVLLSCKRRIQEAKARSKTAASAPLKMTPGEIRLMTTMDIFRSSALWEHFRSDGLVDNPMDRLYSYLVFGDS